MCVYVCVAHMMWCIWYSSDSAISWESSGTVEFECVCVVSVSQVSGCGQYGRGTPAHEGIAVWQCIKQCTGSNNL